MKKFLTISMLALFILSGFSKVKLETGISGSIEPADGASKVWAIRDNDSVSVIPMGGKFGLQVKPGNWNLVVEAIAPYKNYFQTVLVYEGGPTDVGVIRLSKVANKNAR